MFNQLKEGLSRALKVAKGQSSLSEANLQETLLEVRNSLIEADVALPVVQELIEGIKQEALGQTVPTHLSAGQYFVSLIQKHLYQMLGGKHAPINLRAQPPAIVLLVGLQGSGKTTFAAKLAHHLKQTLKNKTILLASCDTRRPAAVEQLQLLADQAKVTMLQSDSQEPLTRAKQAHQAAQGQFADVLIMDTAGRFSGEQDSELMEELRALVKLLKPTESYLVVDSMLGQEALSVAKGFAEVAPLTGIALTKADSDARGGAALSAFHTTQVPIKFMGTGEGIDKLEPFHPDRVVGRILGMGDMLGLIEKAEQNVDKQAQARLMKRAAKGEVTLEDFKSQIQEIQKMGGMGDILSKLPMGDKLAPALEKSQPEKMFKRYIAMIDSMTSQERQLPDILNASRKRRIASGSGSSVTDLNQLLKQFKMTGKMMKKGGKGMAGMLGALGGMGKFPQRPF